MTNNTKKRTNIRGSEDAPSALASSSTSTSDPGSPTLEELRAQNKELERRLRKYKGLLYLSGVDDTNVILQKSRSRLESPSNQLSDLKEKRGAVSVGSASTVRWAWIR
jgi:hypothetical protein